MLKTIGTVGLLLVATGFLTFTVLVLATMKWWIDGLGRLIAAFLGSATLIMLFVVAQNVWPELPGRMWVRAIGYSTLGVVIWSAVGTYIWAQFLRRRNRRRSDGERS